MTSTIELIEGLLARPELDPEGDNAKRLRRLLKHLKEHVCITPPDMRFINQCFATLANIECGSLDHYARCMNVLCPHRGRACPMVEAAGKRFAACDYYIGGRSEA